MLRNLAMGLPDEQAEKRAKSRAMVAPLIKYRHPNLKHELHGSSLSRSEAELELFAKRDPVF